MAKKTPATLRRALERIARDLDELNEDWALVGGLAVGTRAEPRFTRDVDVAVAVPSDREAESLVHALQQRGYTLVMTLEHQPTGRLGTVRLRSPAAPGVLVDLLFAACGVEAETVEAASRGTVMAGLRLPVAQRAHLLAMKVLSAHPNRRPHDFSDIQALLVGVTPAETRAVEVLLSKITQRGFSRRLNLQAKWRAARVRFAPSVRQRHR